MYLKKQQPVCSIDPAGPSGPYELVLTISTARALTSLWCLRIRTEPVEFQHYQYAAHMP